MTQSRSDRLVRELFALYSKYGATEFRNAVAEIESGGASRLIATLAQASAEGFEKSSASSPARAKSKTPKDRFATFLSVLKGSSEQEKQMVASFSEKIAQKKVLVNTRILAEFANQLGISIGHKVDRYILAQKIAESLNEKSASEIARILQIASQMDGQKSSLQEWSKIIVKG